MIPKTKSEALDAARNLVDNIVVDNHQAVGNLIIELQLWHHDTLAALADKELERVDQVKRLADEERGWMGDKGKGQA